MTEDSEVIVIGGGPCGSFAALRLAQKGIKVLVCEEHGKIGEPSHCAGHLSIKGLTSLGMYPLPEEIIENTYRGATFHSPNCTEFSVRLASDVTCAVDRMLFDKYVAEQAQRAGAQYSLNTRVTNLAINEHFVQGAITTHAGRTEIKKSRLIIDAEGVPARLLKEAGVEGPRPGMIVNGIETEVENVRNVELDSVDVYLGSKYAPGFYAWIMPKKNGRAKVGLAAKNRNPKEMLKAFFTKHPSASVKLRNARTLKTIMHPISLGGPIRYAYSDGFMAVGDAASQVKSTTGGGVVFGMTCAGIAAQVAHEAIRQNDCSSESLSTYRDLCEQVIGFDAKTMVRIRKRLDKMSDERLDNLLNACSRLGLHKTLYSVNDVDLQGRVLLQVLRSPRMFPLLGYFLLEDLLENLKIHE